MVAAEGRSEPIPSRPRLGFASEHRSLRLGQVVFADDSLRRALKRYRAFADVTVWTRVSSVDDAPEARRGYAAMSGDLTVSELPGGVGLAGLLSTAFQVRRSARSALGDLDGVVVRVPGPIGSAVARMASRRGLAVIVEVVGDPADVFTKEAASVMLRRLARRITVRQLRRTLSFADVAVYVTSHTLQQRYPASPQATMVGLSDVEIDDEHLLGGERSLPAGGNRLSIVSVASMEQRYKRVDLSIELVKRLRARSVNADLIIVGDGVFRSEYEQVARTSEVPVTFTGQIDRATVLQWMDKAQIYISTATTEGLPRALIEAMSRGLPVVAFDVGGTSELIPGVRLVPSGDLSALESRVIELLDADVYRHASCDAIESSRRYSRSSLASAEDHLRKVIEARVAGHSARPGAVDRSPSQR